MKGTEHFKSVIQVYLDNRASYDELFAVSFANPAKSVDECIVGGRSRLLRLIGRNKIRSDKRKADAQNGKWYCNAYDVIRHATLKGRR